MRAIRHFLRDRLLAGMYAALAVYILLLQALLAGMAQGALAASAADPLNIVCTNGNGVSHSGGQGDRTADCPCATLCRLAATAQPAILVVTPALAAPLADASEIARHFAPLAPVLRRDLTAAPRAPPIFC